MDSAFERASIILKCLRNELSEAESSELNAWLNADVKNRELFNQLTSEQYIQQELVFFQNTNVDIAWKNVAAQTVEQGKMIKMKPGRTRWWYAAAAVLIMAVSVTVFQLTSKQAITPDTAKTTDGKKDANPGGNKAVLILADGSQIILDSAANGNLAMQGNANVTKQDGQLIYNGKGDANQVAYNTISIPKGGQYQLVLADGSKVWMNAASSLRYPAAFTGKERRVELTGEAYFEVAKDKGKPFKVNVAGKGEVEVLGTHFNINAYNDEPAIKTTLLEGVVKFSDINTNRSQLLSPGQQVQLKNNGQLSLSNDIDIDEVMAWKNGLFRLNSADIPTLMRQVARWYDLDVAFEGKIPEGHISGTVPRSMSLAKVLEALQMSDIKFRIEGKKMIITQ